MTTTAMPICECGADDYNDQGCGPLFKRVLHALNCPKFPGPRATQADWKDELTDALKIGMGVKPAPQAEDGSKVDDTWPMWWKCEAKHGPGIKSCPHCPIGRAPRPAPAPSEQPRTAAGDGVEVIDWKLAAKSVQSWAASSNAACDDHQANVARAFKAMSAEIQELKAESEAYSNRTISALRAELAAADQNLKTMLQAAGDEAARQLAEKDKRIEALETELSLAVVPDDHEAEERAVLQAELAAAREEVSAEKDRADKAEQRVRELEAQL